MSGDYVTIDGHGNLKKLGNVLSEVVAERISQDIRWGEQNHNPVYWIAVVTEEIGEAAKAAVQFDWKQYRKELIHTAAVAVNAVESFDRGKWPVSKTGAQSKAVDVPASTESDSKAPPERVSWMVFSDNNMPDYDEYVLMQYEDGGIIHECIDHDGSFEDLRRLGVGLPTHWARP